MPFYRDKETGAKVEAVQWEEGSDEDILSLLGPYYVSHQTDGTLCFQEVSNFPVSMRQVSPGGYIVKNRPGDVTVFAKTDFESRFEQFRLDCRPGEPQRDPEPEPDCRHDWATQDAHAPPEAYWRCAKCGKILPTRNVPEETKPLGMGEALEADQAKERRDKALLDYLENKGIRTLEQDMAHIIGEVRRELTSYLRYGLHIEGVSQTIARDGLVKIHVSVEREDQDA